MSPENRLDALLINPPWISKDENIWHGIKSAMPPLGLLSVAAYAEKMGFSVAVLDIHVEKLSADEVAERVKELRPRVVGLSVVTATANASHSIARLLKKTEPDCLVVFGGAHPETVPEEVLCNLSVDVVVRGDGEETFVELLAGRPLFEVAGISYREGREVLHNPSRVVEMNLDKYPFPAYHLVPMHKYYPAIGAYKRLPAINMVMTRGCPGKCNFCNSAKTVLRTRSAEHVVEEIKHLKQAYGIREIQFYDDTFTVMKQNVMKFCSLMAEARLDVTWAAFVRADCFSEEMAKAMKAAGCHQLLCGVESGDEQILRTLGKPIDRERTRAFVKIARRVGIDTRTAFIFGNQGETVASMQRTLDYSLELDADIALYNICTPYPGTQLYKWAKENGYLVTDEWSDYELSSMVMRLPTVSEAEIQRFYQDAHQKFYLRPISIWRRLVRVTSLSQIRDLVHAFFYIVLRTKVGRRGDVRKDWRHFRKQEFFDYQPNPATPAKLTFEIREAKVALPRDILGPANPKSESQAA